MALKDEILLAGTSYGIYRWIESSQTWIPTSKRVVNEANRKVSYLWHNQLDQWFALANDGVIYGSTDLEYWQDCLVYPVSYQDIHILNGIFYGLGDNTDFYRARRGILQVARSDEQRIRLINNPVKGNQTVEIDMHSTNPSYFEVRDVLGRLREVTVNESGNGISFTFSTLVNPGLYFIQIHGVRGPTETLKLVVE